MHPIFGELVATLEEIAAALAGRDIDRAERTLLRAKKIDDRMSGFEATLAAGYETARFAPPRRSELRHLELYAAAASQIDLAVADVGVWPVRPCAPCTATAPPWSRYRRLYSMWRGRWRP